MIEHGELEATAQRHAAHFAALADEARRKLRGSDAEWYHRIERELRDRTYTDDAITLEPEEEAPVSLAG